MGGAGGYLCAIEINRKEANETQASALMSSVWIATSPAAQIQDLQAVRGMNLARFFHMILPAPLGGFAGDGLAFFDREGGSACLAAFFPDLGGIDA